METSRTKWMSSRRPFEEEVLISRELRVVESSSVMSGGSSERARTWDCEVLVMSEAMSYLASARMGLIVGFLKKGRIRFGKLITH
jgi:hypothetical protein